MSPNKHSDISSPSLSCVSRTRTWQGDNRRTPHLSIGDAGPIQAFLRGMQATTRPNGEPRRSVLEILDGAIALEERYQQNRSGAVEQGMGDDENLDAVRRQVTGEDVNGSEEQ